MKLLIILTTFIAITKASEICEKFVKEADSYNKELSINPWLVKKFAINFVSYNHVERVFHHMWTAFNCDYISVKRYGVGTKYGLSVVASHEDSKDCPPFSVPWKDSNLEYPSNYEKMDGNNLKPGGINAHPVNFIYKYVHEMFFVVVSCVPEEDNTDIGAMAFVNREMDFDEMKDEILKVFEKLYITETNIWFFEEKEDGSPCMCGYDLEDF